MIAVLICIFVSGALRSAHTLPERRAQYLSHDPAGLVYVDTVHCVVIYRHNDISVLWIPSQRGTAE